MTEDTFSLKDFKGTSRLFPMPNLVVFPHVVQPLHIFESRYIEMLEHAVNDDHLLAMGLLLPGWEGQYEGRPAVDPMVCISRILTVAPTKGDQYNILLGGIARARIIQELPALKSYREVELEVLSDVDPDAGTPEVQKLHKELVTTFRKFIPDEESAHKQFGDLLDQYAHLGTLTDLISYSLPLELAFRQALLTELDVITRARLLLERLRRRDSDDRPFPPDFSEN